MRTWRAHRGHADVAGAGLSQHGPVQPCRLLPRVPVAQLVGADEQGIGGSQARRSDGGSLRQVEQGVAGRGGAEPADGGDGCHGHGTVAGLRQPGERALCQRIATLCDRVDHSDQKRTFELIQRVAQSGGSRRAGYALQRVAGQVRLLVVRQQVCERSNRCGRPDPGQLPARESTAVAGGMGVFQQLHELLLKTPPPRRVVHRVGHGVGDNDQGQAALAELIARCPGERLVKCPDGALRRRRSGPEHRRGQEQCREPGEQGSAV